MGKKSSKAENQLAQNRENLAQVGQQRSQQEYDYRTGTRGDITGKYWDLYNQAGADTGGGGGGGGLSAEEQDIINRYKNLADTGGWTPEQIAQNKSWSTAPISGLYAGIQNQLLRQRAGMGMPGTFTSGLGRMAREKAYEMGNIANKTQMDIEADVRNRMATGLDKYAAQIAAAKARARATAAGRASADDRARAEQASYLRALTGMYSDAEDLPYAQLQAGMYGQEGQQLGAGREGSNNTRNALITGAATVAAAL